VHEQITPDHRLIVLRIVYRLSEIISSLPLVISKMLYHDVVEYVCFQRKESSVDPELCMQDYYYEIQLSRKYNYVTPLLRQLNWLPAPSGQTTTL
jgi:hypothetical protein